MVLKNLKAPIYNDLNDQNFSNLENGGNSKICLMTEYSSGIIGQEIENDFSTVNDCFLLETGTIKKY